MLIKKSSLNKAQYLTFDIFEKTGLVRHAFSTRIGGVSSGCFEAMNLWLGSCSEKRTLARDTRENINNNFDIFSKAVGFDLCNTVFSDQVHGIEHAYVTEADRGKGLFKESDIVNIDGLVTGDKNVVLTTFYADCVPLFFLDPSPKKPVIAMSHAGWKGTLHKIAKATINKMEADFSCRPENILCGIGPAIGECCYEVDRSLAEEFLEKQPFTDEFIRGSNNKEKLYLNLKQINKLILLEAGIKEENIELSSLCTKCNPELFYSHRGMGRNRGQMAAVLELI